MASPPRRELEQRVHYVRATEVAGLPRTRTTGFLSFLYACTQKQLDILNYQLPEFRCRKTLNRPWVNHCSFSYATRCTDQSWLEHYRISSAVIIDHCQYGASAVTALGRMTNETQYPALLRSWQRQIEAGNIVTDDAKCEPPQSVMPFSNLVNAVVHCVQSQSRVTDDLQALAEALPNDWGKHFQISTAQFSPSGPISFQDFLKKDAQIEKLDYLKFGRDALTPDIIQHEGAFLADNVRYIEIEYTWRSSWKEARLSSVVKQLKSNGFVCYFAGNFGNLWRITDCFLDHYNLKFWSNIVCANTQLAAPLAKDLESMFQATLRKAKTIKYLNERTIGTDGRKESRKPKK